jgi:predicted naringenin-chalcone synthase
LLAESADAMSWRIGDNGFEMGLSVEVPLLIGQHLRPWLEPWLAEQGTAGPEGWAIHPGGPKILSAVAQALELGESEMACSRAILRDYGNMSSGTVLFELRRLVESGIRGDVVALGFGPGLTAEAMLLRL